MKFLDGENEKLETSFEWIRMNGRPDVHLLLQNKWVCTAAPDRLQFALRWLRWSDGGQEM